MEASKARNLPSASSGSNIVRQVSRACSMRRLASQGGMATGDAQNRSTAQVTKLGTTSAGGPRDRDSPGTRNAPRYRFSAPQVRRLEREVKGSERSTMPLKLSSSSQHRGMTKAFRVLGMETTNARRESVVPTHDAVQGTGNRAKVARLLGVPTQALDSRCAQQLSELRRMLANRSIPRDVFEEMATTAEAGDPKNIVANFLVHGESGATGGFGWVASEQKGEASHSVAASDIQLAFGMDGGDSALLSTNSVNRSADSFNAQYTSRGQVEYGAPELDTSRGRNSSASLQVAAASSTSQRSALALVARAGVTEVATDSLLQASSSRLDQLVL